MRKIQGGFLMNSIIISKKIYASKEMSNYSLAACCAIKSLMRDAEETTLCTTLDILAYELTHKTNLSRRFTTHLKQGFEELINNGFIKVIEKRAALYVLDCSGLIIEGDDKKYTTVSRREIIKIFQIPAVNNYALLKYFTCLMSTVSNTIEVRIDSNTSKQGVVGMFSMQFLSGLSDCLERTIIEYNKLLEENQLVYIYRAGDLVINKETGELNRLTNVYGRFEDRTYIEKFAKRRKKDKTIYRYVEKNVDSSNEKRKLAQKYNQILKGNDESYSKDEIQQIYSYVLSENQRYQNIYKKSGKEMILNNIRDVSVFAKYNFLTEQ